MLQKRLLWQLYPSFLLIIAISVVGVVWYGSQSLREFYLNQVADNLKSQGQLVEIQISDELAGLKFKEIDDLCKKIGEVDSTRITVILPHGEVIADSDEVPGRMKNHTYRPEFQDALRHGIGNSVRVSETLGKRMMYLAVPVRQDGKVLAVIRTAVPITAIDEAIESMYQKLFLAGAIVAAFAAVISLVLSRKISRPVEQMTDVAKYFASGELNLRLPIPDVTELADLARALNKMAQQLSSRIDAITKEQGQMQAILSSMIEGVLAVDSMGYIVSVNEAAAKLLGIDADRAKGLSIEEAVRNPQLQQYIEDILKTGESTEGDFYVLNDRGRCLQMYGSGLTDSRSGSGGAVLVLHDITRTRHLEEVRRDFVANVSHELKTPVTAIKGFVETLLEGAVNEPGQPQLFLEIIARHADRLNAIIEDLLSLSRLEEDGEKRKLSFEVTGIMPPLASAIELSKVKADQKHIAVELLCDEKITARINAALIEQAVLNLVDNAIKYSRENSTIKVDVLETGNEIVIRVSDHGCGIAQEHLDRIFERFYVVDKGRSRKLGGTGLGLSIVKHIAQVHGGSVSVESRLDSGSTFTIHLPLTSPNGENHDGQAS